VVVAVALRVVGTVAALNAALGGIEPVALDHVGASVADIPLMVFVAVAIVETGFVGAIGDLAGHHQSEASFHFAIQT